jgi:two-component system CheB/CheR fusion protein
VAPVPVKKKNTTKKKQKVESFPMVAIGASAGGLEAVTLLLQNVTSNTGMAFIYVQHLSPDHKSILTSLLSKTTLMKVQEVTDRVLMKPDNFYVIPPDKEIAVTDGHIKLSPRRKDQGINLPINTLFCSLAEIHRERAIGVILSGSASDGTIGLRAIKDHGGLTFAQDDSAKFGSMPRSAIAAGVVDFVLSPKEIGRELTRLSKHDFKKRKSLHPANDEEIENTNPAFRSILQLLYKDTGVDFNHYKMGTIKRRIIRRMQLNKKTIAEYASLVADKNDEVNILFQDLLINVTGFFRDTDAHRYLKTKLFPQLLKSKKPGEPLRIWIPACSTGEEAYSIAMLLLEIKETKPYHTPVQIFATDLSTRAIAKARLGEYSKQDLTAVSPKRLQRFYTKAGTSFRISKIVRNLCVFAPHNVLRDPPFSHVDVVSCCNLLIYLDTEAQKKAISTFHYSLNEGGFLMLGKSETIGSSIQLFNQVNSRFKIYSRKKKNGAGALPVFSVGLPIGGHNKEFNNKRVPTHALPESNFDKAVDAVLLAHFKLASVVVNYGLEILQFRGATEFFLRHTSGKASLNILKMASPEIAYELRMAISKSIKTKGVTKKTGIEIKIHNESRLIAIEVIPLAIDSEEPLLLILFTEPEHVETLSMDGERKSGTHAEIRKIRKLEAELTAARSDMHALTLEQEAFNEELQSANEEAVSSNEELRSVNEELETSKEEVESANEELITTNQELQTRNDLLNESYNYSEAIIQTIHEPMLILDKELRIKSASKSFYKNFHIEEKDTEGILLYDLGNRQWNIPRLRKLLEEIITKNSHFHDFEVTHTFPGIGERILLLNAKRIVQQTHGKQLILLAINDITEHTLLQRKEKELLKKDIVESKSYNVTLEKAVEARTKELEHARKNLEDKNIDLEKMNTELEAFTYVSSHDLQEPLRKIQTFSARIMETENENLTEKGKDYFVRMQAAAGRMQQLIEDLLAFSRLTITERKFENTSLTKIVDDVKIEMREIIDEKHAKLVSTGLCEVNVIPFQFRQLVQNLISNSLKFTSPDRSPVITISSRVELGSKLNAEKQPQSVNHFIPDRKYCHLSVADNGIGFDPIYKERIFEVFQKLHGKHEYSGTGIGLAIVKKVVENHSGFVRVTSKPNKGSTFNIYIPA